MNYEPGFRQLSPNPFGPSNTVVFATATATHVRLRVLDVQGRVIRTLVNRRLRPGEYSVSWQGTTNSGHPVASGVYFYKLGIGDESFVRKVLLIK
jgi:flagellar hook assembly protein FlgD